MAAQSLGSVKVLVQPETEAGYRSLGAERDQEMGLAGAGVPVKHSGWPFLTDSHTHVVSRVW